MGPSFRRVDVVRAAAIAALAAQMQPVRAQDLPSIKLASPTTDAATSALFAAKAGLFRRNGLNVEITAMNSGAATTSAVVGGAVQFGHSTLMSLIEAHVKRIPFTLVGSSGQLDTNIPSSALVVRKDAPLRTGRDFNGKIFATGALRDLNEILALAFVDKNGGDASTLRFVELPQSATVQAIAEGRVDAGILGVPFLTQGLEAGTVRIFPRIIDAVAPRFIHIGWYTLEDYANKNRDIVERFARTMHEAAIYCNTHQTETAPLVVDFAKLDPKLVARMTRVTFAEYLTPQLIQPLIDVAAKYRAIDKGFDAQELISPYALKPPR
jgi:NitT/TauT family transport system substrate-binding protein